MFPRWFCLSLLVLGAACRRPSDAVPAPHPRFAAWNRQQAKPWAPRRVENGPTVWTDAPERVDVLLAEYRHALAALQAAAPLPQALEAPSIYLFSNPADFQAVVGLSQAGLHRGASEPGHVFLSLAQGMEHGNALAHELAHQHLLAAFPTLPRWLEEGWVLWIAEDAAKDLARKRLQVWQPPAYRVHPAAELPETPVWDLADYPADRDALIAFYDRSRELVRALRPRFGEAEWSALVQRICAAGPENALREAGWEGELWLDLLAKARLSAAHSPQVRR
jgi:hypothetical protein